MKAIRITAAVLLLMLTGCAAKKTATNESSALTDTTKSESGNITARQTNNSAVSAYTESIYGITDTTRTTAGIEENAVISFVDNGGFINFDAQGNITITGVKSIWGSLRQRKNEVKGFTRAGAESLTAAKETAKNEEIADSYNRQENGIAANEQKQSQREQETKITRPKWYQTVLAKIGSLCCIAALLWAIFLYLKRKF